MGLVERRDESWWYLFEGEIYSNLNYKVEVEEGKKIYGWWIGLDDDDGGGFLVSCISFSFTIYNQTKPHTSHKFLSIYFC